MRPKSPSYIRIWKIGERDRPADDVAIKDFKRLLKKARKSHKKGKPLDIVTHHAVTCEIVPCYDAIQDAVAK